MHIDILKAITTLVADLRAQGRKFPDGIEGKCAAACPPRYDAFNMKHLNSAEAVADFICNYLEAHEIKPVPNTHSPWHRSAA